jgi:hypothetical protein
MKNIKRHLIVYIAVAALAIATPEFDARVNAEERSGFFFLLEGRGSLSEGDGTPWAEGIVNSGQQGLIPTGNVDIIDTDHARFSGRLGGGYRSGALDFGIFYSGLQALDDQDNVNATASYYRINVLQTFALPVVFGGTPQSIIRASSSVTYNVVDFEAGFKVKLGMVDIRLFGGIRYSELDQDVNTHFAVFSTVGIQHRDVDFWGVGPRVGASASMPVAGAFGVTASASGAALFGEQNTVTTSSLNISPGINERRRSVSRTSGNFEGELGVTFNHQMNNASRIIFALGYRAEAWLDVNNTQSEPPTFSGTIYGTRHADQIFHGPFLRGEWRFD